MLRPFPHSEVPFLTAWEDVGLEQRQMETQTMVSEGGFLLPLGRAQSL